MILKHSTKSDELAEVISFVDDPGFTRLPGHVRKAALARKKGIEGEKYTAHILDRKFFNLGDHALIHDLRIPDGIGGYAQFDHVVLSRLSRTASIFEVKNYGGRLSRNAHDEWMLWYEGRRRPVSIANPLAQVRRQREVLRDWLRVNHHDKAFEQIGVFVIMPPGCDIDRKSVTSKFSVYKADQGHLDLVDLGDVLATIALENGHALATYDIANDEALSTAEIAALIASIGGQAVAPGELATAQLVAGLEAAGPAYAYVTDAMGLLATWQARTGGRGNANCLRWLLGREPGRFDAYVRRSLAAVPHALVEAAPIATA